MIPLISSPLVIPLVRRAETVVSFGQEIEDSIEILAVEDEIE